MASSPHPGPRQEDNYWKQQIDALEPGPLHEPCDQLAFLRVIPPRHKKRG